MPLCFSSRFSFAFFFSALSRALRLLALSHIAVLRPFRSLSLSLSLSRPSIITSYPPPPPLTFKTTNKVCERDFWCPGGPYDEAPTRTPCAAGNTTLGATGSSSASACQTIDPW